MSLTDLLYSKQDLKYKEFHSKLIPGINTEKIIGVRIPDVRKIAKDFKNTDEAESFVKSLPHKYYEENNLHAFFICEIRDYNLCIKELNRFLPYVDNWATCDSIRPFCFKYNKPQLIEQIKFWLLSDDVYTVRFALEMLMVHFLDEEFKKEIHNHVLAVKNDDYYIKMMIAWYFATALAKQWDCTVLILEKKLLSPWVHNKTISKAIESYRISDSDKTYLKTLKI